MKILVLGLNYAPELIGIGPYTAGLVEALTRAGHSVTVVAGQPYYPEWRARRGHRFFASKVDGPERIIRVPHFIPEYPTGVLRLVHHFSFALTSLVPMLWMALFWRPDRVLAIAPSLMAAPLGLAAARLAGATAWLHVQDFELEAAQATELLSRNRVLGRLFSRLERAILQSFDRVSSISLAMCRKLMDKGVCAQKISEHPNWATTHPHPGTEIDFRTLWNIKTRHVALYSGALGPKHGLDLIIRTARALQHRRDLTFVICGNGPDRAALEASARGLGNIQFRDLQPREDLASLLNLATIHLLPQIAGTQDLVLPSKLPNMLDSGRPVVATAQPGSVLHTEVRDCGIATAPHNVTAFAEAIERLCDNDLFCARLGAAARARSKRRWCRQVLVSAFVADIERAEKAASGTSAAEQRP